MRLSVSLPFRTERQLEKYCPTHKLSKSEVIVKALDLLFAKAKSKASAYELGKDLFDVDNGSAQRHFPYSTKNLRDLVKARALRR